MCTSAILAYDPLAPCWAAATLPRANMMAATASGRTFISNLPVGPGRDSALARRAIVVDLSMAGRETTCPGGSQEQRGGKRGGREIRDDRRPAAVRRFSSED